MENSTYAVCQQKTGKDRGKKWGKVLMDLLVEDYWRQELPELQQEGSGRTIGRQFTAAGLALELARQRALLPATTGLLLTWR